MSELSERVRRFWFELWNERAIDTLREELHPDFRQVDHRALTDSGPTRSDWEELMRSWWEELWRRWVSAVRSASYIEGMSAALVVGLILGVVLWLAGLRAHTARVVSGLIVLVLVAAAVGSRR